MNFWTFSILFFVTSGIGTIDIELTEIDINQCDPDIAEAEVTIHTTDVFRGTHNCQPSTRVSVYVIQHPINITATPVPPS